jgi:hypothetical protein
MKSPNCYQLQQKEKVKEILQAISHEASKSKPGVLQKSLCASNGMEED